MLTTEAIGEWSRTGSGNCVSFLELLNGLVRAEIRWDESSSLDVTKSLSPEDRSRVWARPNYGKPYWVRINGDALVNPETSQRTQWSSVREAQEAVADLLRPLIAEAAVGFGLSCLERGPAPGGLLKKV